MHSGDNSRRASTSTIRSWKDVELPFEFDMNNAENSQNPNNANDDTSTRRTHVEEEDDEEGHQEFNPYAGAKPISCFQLRHTVIALTVIDIIIDIAGCNVVYLLLPENPGTNVKSGFLLGLGICFGTNLIFALAELIAASLKKNKLCLWFYSVAFICFVFIIFLLLLHLGALVLLNDSSGTSGGAITINAILVILALLYICYNHKVLIRYYYEK